MTEQTPRAKNRPAKEVDWKKIDQLLLAGCMGTEIAPHFDMHPDTLYLKVQAEYGMTFTAYSQLKRSQGDSLLKAKQFEKAMEKDNTMLIWLGKTRLNQKEAPDEYLPDQHYHFHADPSPNTPQSETTPEPQ